MVTTNQLVLLLALQSGEGAAFPLLTVSGGGQNGGAAVGRHHGVLVGLDVVDVLAVLLSHNGTSFLLTVSFIPYNS